MVPAVRQAKRIYAALLQTKGVHNLALAQDASKRAKAMLSQVLATSH